MTPTRRGAIVDRRLEPAGLTRLLGAYGESRGTVLGAALALLVCAGLTLVLLPWPPASIGMAFIVPVALVAAEFGVRAGLLCAAGSAAMLLAWALATDGHEHGVGGILVRRWRWPSSPGPSGEYPSAPLAAGGCSSRSSSPPATPSTSRISRVAICSSTAPPRSSWAGPGRRSSR